MTREEAIQEFQNVKDLIRQDGKDWFDERDLELIDMAIEALQDRLTGEWIKHEIEDTFKAHLKDAEERTTEVYEYDDFQYAYFLGKAKAYDEVIRRLGGDTE